MRSGSQLSEKEARWLALDAQGLGRPRPARPVDRRRLLAAVTTLGVLQLDAVNVVARTQFLVPFSRVGAYDPAELVGLSGPGGAPLFEYWGHAASLLPATHHPWMRWRMADGGTVAGHGDTHRVRRRAWEEANRSYLRAVHDEVRDRGPLAAGALSDPRRQDGEWWDRRSLGRIALEHLFARGDLAAWRTANFEKVYDIPERVIPPAVLAQPTPNVDDAQRQLVLIAARALGVGTVTDLASYHMLRPRDVRDRVVELVDAGALTAVSVEGWREPGHIITGSRVRRPIRAHATLLSPFDSLIWDRARALRVFGFDYRIEIYVPAPKRRFGYYVMPLLVGDEIVGRFDLKADRAAGVLRVVAAHAEPGVDEPAVADAAAAELDELRSWIGLGRTVVGRKGAFSSAVRAALAARMAPSRRRPPASH